MVFYRNNRRVTKTNLSYYQNWEVKVSLQDRHVVIICSCKYCFICFVNVSLEFHTFACDSGVQFSGGVFIWLWFQNSWQVFPVPVLSEGRFVVIIFHIVIEFINETQTNF